MMLMAFSSIIFSEIADGLKRPWLVYLLLFCLPLSHYFAAIAIVIFPLMHLIYNLDLKGSLLLFASGFVGLLTTLIFAIPQRLRSTGTWFQNHNLFDWPKSLTYSYSANGTMELGHTLWTIAFHFFFLVLVGIALYKLYQEYDHFNWMMKEKRLLYFMMSMMFVTFGYLAFLSLGDGGFFNLYHSRFFLVVMWLFTVAVIISVVDFVSDMKYLSSNKIRPIATIFIALLFVWPAVLQFEYSSSVHNELRTIGEQTPCPAMNQTPILIGHESPFSALPYYVFEREFGCNWDHFIWTNINKGLANAGGYDAFKDPVYWNSSLPTRGFYYVRSSEGFFPLGNRTTETVAQDAGIQLQYVFPAQSKIIINFQ